FYRQSMTYLTSLKIGAKSCHSGRETSRYFRPLMSLLSGGRSSFGISILRELGGSSPYRSRCFCSAICPLRERNQLMKTLDAFGCGAPLIRLSDPPPVERPSPSFQPPVSNSSTGRP